MVISTTLKRTRFGGVDFVDLTFVILMFMSWMFIVQAWRDPVAQSMLTGSVFVLVFYVAARYIGVLQSLELTRPFWTISGLIAIPLWLLVFSFLPAPGGTLPTQDILPNVLDLFVSAENVTFFIQGWAFPITESLIAGVLLSFFIGVGLKRAGQSKRAQLVPVVGIFLVSIFMSLLHIWVVAKFAESGVFEPATVFGHQILSFALMLTAVVIFPYGGMAFLLAPHVVKNLLAFAAPVEVWIFAFSAFVLLDIMSYSFAQKKEKFTYVQAAKNFTR